MTTGTLTGLFCQASATVEVSRLVSTTSQPAMGRSPLLGRLSWAQYSRFPWASSSSAAAALRHARPRSPHTAATAAAHCSPASPMLSSPSLAAPPVAHTLA